jgi:hypothetical protein
MVNSWILFGLLGIGFVQQASSQSSDWFYEANKALQPLNVSQTADWPSLMTLPQVDGNIGHVSTTMDSYTSEIQKWGIPDQDMLTDVLNSAKVLMMSAQFGGIGEYIARSVVFDIYAKLGHLSTVLMVGTKESDSAVGLTYFVSTANTTLIQQFTTQTSKYCERCIKCFFTSACCCKERAVKVDRDDSLDEINDIIQQLKYSQFAWMFNQLNSQNFKGAITKGNGHASV